MMWPRLPTVATLRATVRRLARRGPDQTGELIRAGAGSVGLKGIEAVLGLASSILLARFLGPEEYGTYAFGTAIAGLLAVIGALGIPDLVVREVQAYRARDDWSRLKGLLRWSTGVVLAASVLLAGATGIGMGLLGAGPLTGRAVLPLMLMSVPLTVVLLLHGSTLRGLDQVLLGQIPWALFRPGVLLLWVIVAFVVLRSRFDAEWAAGGFVIGAAIGLISALILLRRRVPEQVRPVEPSYVPRSWIAAALPMAIVGGMHVLNQRTDMVMVGAIAGAEAAGIYRVASQGAMLMALVLTGTNMVVQPMAAALVARRERERLQQLATNGARFVLAVSAPMALAFIGFGGPILARIFGAGFRAGAVPLAILSGGQLVNAAIGSVGVLLMMGGWERQTMWGVAVGATLNVVLNALLVPMWGPIGAAIATAVSIAAWNGILAMQVFRKMGIRPSALVSLRSRS